MTETPAALYQRGDLQGAIDALTQEVKANPRDVERRGFLTELLCFSGSIERADLQLDAIAKQDPESSVGIAVFRQVLRAEQARRQHHLEGRLPDFLGAPSDHMRLLMEASVASREGNTVDALRLVSEAEENRPAAAGRMGDRLFDDFRDLDDLTGGVFEVLTTNGQYYWVPIERIARVEFRAPQRPRDLIWRGATLVVIDGPEGEVFVPALYVTPNGEEVDDRTRLGRATQWIGDDKSPVRGLGQRTFLIDNEDIPIMQIETIEFDTGSG
jgi:type VI secretion system protein ImpE